MKNRLIILSLFAVAGVFCTCSSQAPEKTVIAGQEVPQASNGSDEPPSVAEPPQSVVTPGNDNSEIVTSYDPYGNKTETRTFKGHSYLDNIVIRTLADGSRVGYAVGKNSEKRPLADHHIAVAFVAKADELADMAGFGGVTVVQKIEPVTTEVPIQSPTEPIQPQIEPVQAMPISNNNLRTDQSGSVDEKDAKQSRELLRNAEAERSRQLQREVTRLNLNSPSNQ